MDAPYIVMYTELTTHQRSMSSPVFRHLNDRFDLLIAVILYLLYWTFPDLHMMRLRGAINSEALEASFLNVYVYERSRWLS